MMNNEKQVKRVKIDCRIDWEGYFAIEELRKDLDKLEKLGATHVDIGIYDGHCSPRLEVDSYNEMLETDKEFQQRIENQKMIREHSKLEEFELFKKLKQKYEGSYYV